MVNFLVASALGFLSGMGIGGGSLLMLYLTSLLGMSLREARGLNLLFFIFCAVSASLFRIRKRQIPIKSLWVPMASGVLCAWGFSLLSHNLNEAILKKGFGILLLAVAYRELRYRPRNAR